MSESSFSAEAQLRQYLENFASQLHQDILKMEESSDVLREEELQLFTSETEKESSHENTSQDGSDDRDYNSHNSTEPPAPTASVVRPNVVRPNVVPQIKSVFSSANLGCDLDLNIIARTGKNVEYKPRAQQLIMRIRSPRTTVTIFKSGTIICTGAQSMDDSRKAARRFARLVQKAGFPVRFLNFKIHNILSYCKLFPVCLEKLALDHHQHCRYEPEVMVCLFYHISPTITASVFSNGSITFAGAKSEAELNAAFQQICLILSCYRK